MLDAMNEDYVRTRTRQGLTERQIRLHDMSCAIP